jgi:hypothetical protein
VRCGADGQTDGASLITTFLESIVRFQAGGDHDFDAMATADTTFTISANRG